MPYKIISHFLAVHLSNIFYFKTITTVLLSLLIPMLHKSLLYEGKAIF